MKGVITACLKDMIISKYGADKWSAILKKGNYPADFSFFATEDYADDIALGLVGATMVVMEKTLTEVADDFGQHWVNIYAQRIYHAYYSRFKNSKDFLLGMSEIHRRVTNTVPNAHPPQFEYKWIEDNTLIITYISQRKLIDFVVGLAKGVGVYFKENLVVSKVSDTEVKIVFEQ